MQIEYSNHWLKKKKYRPDITNDSIEYCIQTSIIYKDKRWDDVLNAIAKIPPPNRILKIVYKTKGKNIKILTAYWLN